jgi:hypothetical protein
VRDPGNQPYDGVEDREASEAGVRIGPRIYTTGPLLEWRRVFYRMGVAVSGSGASGARDHAGQGAAIRSGQSYVRMPDLQQRRLVEAAHEMGVPVATHESSPPPTPASTTPSIWAPPAVAAFRPSRAAGRVMRM